MLQVPQPRSPQLTRFGIGVLTFGMCLALIVTTQPATAQETFADLARYVPGSANALVLLNVETVMATRLARLEGWQENLQKAYDSGMRRVPPNATHFIMASQIQFDSMEPLWEMMVMNTRDEISMTDVATNYGGRADTVDKLPAVVLPSNAYAVRFGPQTGGAMYPANRQSVARWVRESKAKKSSALSPYLTEGLMYADKAGTQIILAVDLADIFPTDYIRERLSQSTTVSRKNVDLDELSQVIAGIRGLTLGIVISEKANRPVGKLKVDFQTDPSIMAGFARLLLLEVLGNRGLMVDDFENWKAEVDAPGRMITITGYLSRSGLREVLSVVDAPTTVSAPSETPESAKLTDPKQKMAYASQQYFRSVTRHLDDLGKKSGAKSVGQIGTWFSNYARKIDRLPLVNVDPDLLNYGGYVSEQLREASMAIKGIGMKSRMRAVNVGPGSASGSTWGVAGAWFTTYVQPRYQRQQEVSRVRTEERVAGAESAQQIMQEVENTTSNIRRAMAQKYQIEF